MDPETGSATVLAVDRDTARTLAGIVATIAGTSTVVAAASDWCWVVAAALGAATLLAFIVIWRPEVLPGVKRPTLVARVELFSGSGQRITISPDRENPRSVLIRVQARNPHGGAAPVRNVTVTILAPFGCDLEECDDRGRELSRMQRLAPHEHGGGPKDRRSKQIAAIYEEVEAWVRIWVNEPGAYEVEAFITSPDLAEPSRDVLALRVDEQSDLSRSDVLSEQIDAGELILANAEHLDLVEAFGDWQVETIQRISDDDAKVFDAEPRWPGPKVGDDYRAAQIRSRLDALYELRRRIR